MLIELTDVEVRVLGSLVEKAITTPESYPLSLNALIAACNQKSNREPVVTYTGQTVNGALHGLQDKGLAKTVMGGDSRVPKYRQEFASVYHLSPQEEAVLDVLMLRGPQTVGELRGRSERLYPFRELSDVDAVLEGLATREHPLVVRLPRLPGQKDNRYAHLLSGMPEITDEPVPTSLSTAERVARLEDEVAALREIVESLRAEVAALKE
jgi:uncharacterized protein YceH (UPF0502 family)